METLIDRYPSLRVLLPVLTGIAVATLFVRAVGHFAYTPDDTYIYLRTAQNLASGDGIAFNPGSSSYSVTGPLWALLIAAGSWMNLDPYVVAKGLDLTFASLSVVGLQLLVFTATGDRIMSVLAALMLTFDAWVLRWAGSGMESSLALLLTCVAFRAALLDERLVVGAAAGLLALLRPEYLLLTPWVIVATFEGPWRGHFSRWFWPLVINVVVVSVWWLVATIMTGGPFPSTFAGKASGAGDLSTVGWTIWETLRATGATQGASVIGLTALVLVFHRRLRRQEYRLMLLLVGWPVVVSGVYAVQGVQVISRYFLPMLPLITVATFGVLSWLDVSGVLSVRRVAAVALAIAGVSVGTNAVVYEISVAPHVREFALGMQQAMKPIAYWIRNNTDPADDVLAPDIGMIGYYGQRRVWDPAGLATPSLRRAVDGHSYDEIMTRGLYRPVVDPRYVIDRTRDKERLVSARMRPVMTAEFPSLGVSMPGRQYVTLYEVTR